MIPAARAGEPQQQLTREVRFILCYGAVYVAYLFANPERELLHWLTLVMLPAAAIARVGRYASVAALLRSVGLSREAGRAGWPLALGLALAFQAVQLLNQTQRGAVFAALEAPLGLLLAPLAFALLVGTAATTEEFFFRGILQTRLAALLRSEGAAALLVTGAFVLYHIPYAYLTWPSAGNVSAAVRAAAVNGLVGGLPLGILFWRSRHNLIATVFLHACIDLLPAIRMLATRLAAS